MERKRIEKLVALLLVGILMPVSLFPFRINADTYQITGHNVTLIESTYQNTESITTGGNTSDFNFYRYTYEIEYFLDDYYLGYIEGSFKYYYQYMPTTGSSTTLNNTKNIKVYCNSDSFKFTISFTSDLYDPIVSNNSYITITSANLTKFSDLNSISQIIDILNDIYTNSNDIEGLSTNQLTELQNIVSNTTLANQYLETLTEMMQYHYPIESFQFIYEQIRNEYEIDNLVENYYYDYPVFIVPSNSSIFRFYGAPQRVFDIIFGINAEESANNILLYMNIPNDYNASVISANIRGINTYRFYHIQLTPKNEVVTGWKNISFTRQYKFIPIFTIDFSREYHVSTEFALQWGLTNRFLDDIEIIANGTAQSSSASGSLDQATSQFSDEANDLVTIEESFNNSMNSSLQNVNPTFNMGSSFLTSANWVSQQFNRIVNNTPFASLITFGLTLGLGLLIIGKVRK